MATKVKSFQDKLLHELTQKVEAFLEKHPNIKIIGLNSHYEIKLVSGTSYAESHCMILIYEEGE